MEDCKDSILHFFVIYKQFGHVPSESIASPALFITKVKNPRRYVSTPIYVLAA